MDGSFYTADRATYRRVMLTALAAATLVLAISVAARGLTSHALAGSRPVTKTFPVAAPATAKMAYSAADPASGSQRA